MKISKWGNSLAIRLPAGVVQELKLKAGDEVNIRVAGADSFIVEREMTREEAIARIRKMGRPLSPGFEFDREEANDNQRPTLNERCPRTFVARHRR